MCVTCGCSEGATVTIETETAEHTHVLPDGQVITHRHHHHHEHQHPEHSQGKTQTLTLAENLLAKNDLWATRNRLYFQEQGLLALNLVSSPGSGKTTLLTRTLTDLRGQIPFCVVEGDQATSHDAQRIRETGCAVVQVNTGTGCHLEAAMIHHSLETLQPPRGAVVMIENVGNLVCPALFDLGEKAKVAILSVTEGEDKPLKYPHMFRASQVMILNKMDLLPYVNFDRDRCVEYARQVNPDLQIFEVSATTGEGLSTWYDWLKTQLANPG